MMVSIGMTENLYGDSATDILTAVTNMQTIAGSTTIACLTLSMTNTGFMKRSAEGATIEIIEKIKL